MQFLDQIELSSAPGGSGERCSRPDPWRAVREAGGPRLGALLERGALRPAFQPIVDLDHDRLLGFEALARWPGTEVTPDAAFAAARSSDRLGELDWACRTAALEAALEAGIGREVSLFVNVEPAVLGTVPRAARALLDEAQRRLRVVVEITERALASHPATLLSAVARIRDRGWGIALDDVGAEPESLAMLPLVRPDVVKLDLSLLQQHPSTTHTEVLAAVLAYAEDSGAVILAEGIEDAADLERARAYGATAGQGWHLGRPGPLPQRLPPVGRLVVTGTRLAVTATPFDAVELGRTQVGSKRLLLEMTAHLERQAGLLAIPPVVLSSFQRAERFGPRHAVTYSQLASRSPLVVVLGVGMQPEPAPGVRGIRLDPLDPLVEEWSVVVLGAHYAAALITRDLGDRGPDLDRRFEFTLTHDRLLTVTAARSLLRRADPAARPGDGAGSPEGSEGRAPLERREAARSR